MFVLVDLYKHEKEENGKEKLETFISVLLVQQNIKLDMYRIIFVMSYKNKDSLKML